MAVSHRLSSSFSRQGQISSASLARPLRMTKRCVAHGPVPCSLMVNPSWVVLGSRDPSLPAARFGRQPIDAHAASRGASGEGCVLVAEHLKARPKAAFEDVSVCGEHFEFVEVVSDEFGDGDDEAGVTGPSGARMCAGGYVPGDQLMIID